MPDCKYIKYAKTKNISNFWDEKAVTALLKDAFAKKTPGLKDFAVTPRIASIMLVFQLK